MLSEPPDAPGAAKSCTGFAPESPPASFTARLPLINSTLSPVSIIIALGFYLLIRDSKSRRLLLFSELITRGRRSGAKSGVRVVRPYTLRRLAIVSQAASLALADWH